MMPAISNGLCTPKLNEDPAETAALELWMKLGGRGVDTAWNYNQQVVVGWAINNATQEMKDDLFVTTKIPCVASAEAALSYVEQDLQQLNVSSVDLVLIHSPGYGTAPVGQPVGCWGHQPCCMNASQLQDTWRGLETALAKNLTKAIGVSNFRTEHLEDVAATAKTLPAVNQCQMYVGSHDDDAIARCKEQGIVYEAYSPLGPWHRPKTVLTDKTVAAIAKVHNVSSAVVGMRWIVQQNLTIVTATADAAYDIEDLDAVFSFALTAAEMDALSAVKAPTHT